MFKKVSVILMSLLFTLSVTACGNGGGSTSTNTVASSNKLTIAINADMGTLDPGVSMDNLSWKITYPAYERLLELKGSTTDLKPGLAEKWKVSTDGLVYTFTLSKGHKFSDGTEVNAAAVKFTFDRILAIAKGPADTYGVIKQIKVIDANTVEFDLKNAFPPFLSTLTTNYGGIVNPKVMQHEKSADKAQDYLSNHTAGSGTYQLKDWKKGDYIELTLNPNVTVNPVIKEVYFKFVADASAARLQLEKNDIDIAEGIPIEQLNEMKDKVNLVKKPSLFVDYVYLNSTKGNVALKNTKVRQAINYAVDYKSIISKVMMGYATPMVGPIPAGLWGHDSTLKQYTYDKEKAKSLLKESGVKNIQLDLLYSDRFPNWEQEALVMQSNLADIGIKLNLNKVAYATMRDEIDAGKFDLSMGVWSPDYADPFMFMNYWFDSKNAGLSGDRAFYVNKDVDVLLRKAASIGDKTERTKIYIDVQKTVIEDAPYIYLYQKDFVLPISKNVKGNVYNPMLEGIYNFSQMSKVN